MQGTGNSEWTLIANRFSCLTVSHFEKWFPSFAFSQSWIDVVLPKAFAEISNQKVPEGARRDKLAQFLFLVIEEYHWQGWWKWFPQAQTVVWTDCVWGVGLSCSLSFFLLLRTSSTFTFLQSSLCWWWVSGGFVPEERGFTLFPRRIWVARMGCINLWKDFCLMFTVWHWEDVVWVRLHRDTELIGYMYRYCKEEWTHMVVIAKSQDGMPAG